MENCITRLAFLLRSAVTILVVHRGWDWIIIGILYPKKHRSEVSDWLERKNFAAEEIDFYNSDDNFFILILENLVRNSVIQ